eukprot:8170151-Lingulodinium_polyedra.AAC.1
MQHALNIVNIPSLSFQTTGRVGRDSGDAALRSRETRANQRPRLHCTTTAGTTEDWLQNHFARHGTHGYADDPPGRVTQIHA